VISHPLDITDAWKNSYSCSTNHKVWAAKFTARHPNLVALEISSFKCGHDAPIYGVIEGISSSPGRPISASRIWTRTSLPVQSGFASRPSIISCAGIAKKSSGSAKQQEDIEAQLTALEAELRGQAVSDVELAQPLQVECEAQGMAAD